jgi:hypothetical protein
MSVCVCVRAVENGSLDLAAQAARLQAFLIELAIQGAPTRFTMQWQMHRTRDARVFGCHSGCRLLSQGGPGVRLARHRRRRQALQRQGYTARRIGGYARRLRRTLCSHDFQRASRKLSVHSPCAHHVPNYTAQALRARGKRAVVLPHAFGLPAIVAGRTLCATSAASAAAASRSKHCDDNDTQPDASAAATSTATTTTHSPTTFHTAGVAAAYAMLAWS